ncbi:CotH kinase family protein [Dermatobacter hominis]|uniref:CotH kinase family protein n=1 Tax=Dermatobacter hominis TaxID=2884263 RepID=UPI001D12BDC0|nr:CotH kinase family protein [Dermatobacter hominis]UDY37798.1 CotH kinase family protein [Dermatobacter hominis]
MGTTTGRWTGGPARGRIAAVVTTLVLALLAASCTTSPSVGPGTITLRTTLVATGFELAWSGEIPAGTTATVQVRSLGPDHPTGWVSQQAGTATSATFTDVDDGDTYQLKVIAVAGDGTTAAWSDITTATFVRTTLPVVRIETAGRAPVLSTEDYVAGTLSLDPGTTGFPAVTGAAEVRVRGNSTALPDKKPYKVKLQTKASLLGMPTEKDWVLLANWFDRSNLRTHTAFELGRSTGLAWTPRDRFVEVVVNGDYRGVYLLTEQVEVSAQRVGITEMDEADVSGEALTGGYLLEVDQRLEQNQEPGFRSAAGVPIVVKDPDPAAPEQLDHVRSLVADLEQRLYSPGFADRTTGYRAVLDTPSLVDWYLVEEVMRNQEAWFSSTFMTKDRGGLLEMGPLWDFDLSSGSPTSVEQGTQGWKARIANPWSARLFEDPTLVAEVEARWAQMEPAFRQVAAGISATGAALAPATASDRARWGDSTSPTADSPAFLRSWLEQRIDWLDAQYG